MKNSGGPEKVTFKQQRFVDLLLLGKTGVDAYREAFSSKAKPQVLRVKAVEMKKRPQVQAYMAAEQAKTAELVGLTRAEKRRLLRMAAMDSKAPWSERLKAIALDNLMTGDNKPVRFEGEVTLAAVFRALHPTTGLLREDEVIELDPNGVEEQRPAELMP